MINLSQSHLPFHRVLLHLYCQRKHHLYHHHLIRKHYHCLYHLENHHHHLHLHQRNYHLYKEGSFTCTTVKWETVKRGNIKWFEWIIITGSSSRNILQEGRFSFRIDLPLPPKFKGVNKAYKLQSSNSHSPNTTRSLQWW